MFNQVEQLKADIARLRGQLEVLAHEQDETQKRQRDLYVDLDTRLRKLETGAPPPAAADGTRSAGDGAGPAATAPARRAARPGGAARRYRRATGAPPGARPGAAAADGTPSSAPTTPRSTTSRAATTPARSAPSPRSRRRIRKARSRRRRSTGSATPVTRSAITAARSRRSASCVATYPDSQKVPDAMLNIATAQSELGDSAAARRTLDDLVAKYPQSEAAGKARQRLSAR